MKFLKETDLSDIYSKRLQTKGKFKKSRKAH